MLVHITDETYAKTLASIYNSANMLFPESERKAAAPDIFTQQLKEDENFLEITDNKEAAAFMSYHCYKPSMSKATDVFDISYKQYFEIRLPQSPSFRQWVVQLSSLYVKREYQRMGLGAKMLQYLEEQMQNNGIIFVKVLNNAPWAKNFYCKNGYFPLDTADTAIKEIAASFNIIERSYSSVLVNCPLSKARRLRRS